MPRFTAIRNVLAIFTMAVASLCGGGKAVAEQAGTLTVVELRGDVALRPEAHKRAGNFLRKLLQDRHPDWFIRTKDGSRLAIWSPEGIGDALSELPSPRDFGFHAVAKAEQSDLREGRVAAGHVILSASDDPERLFAIKSTPLLDASDVADASAAFGTYGAPIVSFSFTPEAANIFGRWTQKSIGQPFAIVVDGEVLSAPIIREPILGGSGQISGNFTLEEAERLSERLNAPLEGIDFVIAKTCSAARPRAPPNKAIAWLTPLPTCE